MFLILHAVIGFRVDSLTHAFYQKVKRDSDRRRVRGYFGLQYRTVHCVGRDKEGELSSLSQYNSFCATVKTARFSLSLFALPKGSNTVHADSALHFRLQQSYSFFYCVHRCVGAAPTVAPCIQSFVNKIWRGKKMSQPKMKRRICVHCV